MLKPEELPNTHIVICTPCYGGQVFQNYFMSILRFVFMANKHSIPVSFIVRGGDSLIPRIRNSIVAEVLASPQYTHLMWVDADIGFDPEAIIRLILADKDVACGLYPLKKIVWPEKLPADMTLAEFNARYTHYPYNPLPGAVFDQDGFVEVRDAPTGFMLVKREVLERMVAHYPDLKYTPEIMLGLEGLADTIANFHYRFFDVMTEPNNGRYLSEDYAFCRRWQEMGGKIYIDGRSKLTHQGSHMFEGDFLASVMSHNIQHT